MTEPPITEPLERGVFARLCTTLDWSTAVLTAASVLALLLVVSRGELVDDESGDTVWSRVIAGAAATTITFHDSRIVLDANSSIVLQSTKPTVWIERGSADFSVTPNHPELCILIGDVIVRSTDASFRISRDSARTDIAVSAGTVELRSRGSATTVTGGHSWTRSSRDR